jgi:hypothetical protein
VHYGRVLVGCALSACFDTPIKTQRVTVEEAERRVGITDVDNEKHEP